jgi:hypothetical protein
LDVATTRFLAINYLCAPIARVQIISTFFHSPFLFPLMIFLFLCHMIFIFNLTVFAVYFRNQSKSTNDMSPNEQGATVFESPSRGDEKTSASSKWPQVYGNIFTSANILFALPRIYMVSTSLFIKELAWIKSKTKVTNSIILDKSSFRDNLVQLCIFSYSESSF